MPPPQPTRRIEFRCLDDSDVIPLVALHQSARVASLIADGLIDSPEMALHYVAAMGAVYAQRPGLGVWMGVDRETNAPIGLFGLMPIDGGTDIEIGARLLESGWGRDYAIEGCAALVTHAFSAVNLEFLWATCLPEHRSAQFVLARLGFEFHGHRLAYGSQLVAFTKRRNPNEMDVPLRSRRDALHFVEKWQETFSSAESQSVYRGG